MFCPSISLTRFEDMSLPKRSCPCQMANCQCIRTTAETPLADIIPRPVDRWIPVKGQKRDSNQRPKNICVTITRQHTDKAVGNLFRNGIRCVHIQMAYGTMDEIEHMALRVSTEIASHRLRNPDAAEISLAVEIRGRIIRTGRLHNDKPVQLVRGKLVFVTSNKEYTLCSTEQVIFIHNLDEYIGRMQVGEFIFINRYDIQLVVVKVTPATETITCCVLLGSKLESYAPVILPYLISGGPELLPEEHEDCEFAMRHSADFIVVPAVSDVAYLRALRTSSSQSCAQFPALLSQINESYFGCDASQLESIIHASDGIWWSRTPKPDSPIVKFIIARAKQLFVPIIMGLQPQKKNIPGQLLYDFDCFIVSRYNKYIDTTLQHKIDKYYKSVALPDVGKFKETLIKSNEPLSVAICCTALTSLLLQARIIVCISNNGLIPIRLSQNRPPCPILTVVPSRRLARQLNIYKNIRPLVYRQQSDNICCPEPETIQTKLTFALNEAKKLRLVVVGDLVVMCFDTAGTGAEDMISYQTIYVSQEAVQI